MNTGKWKVRIELLFFFFHFYSLTVGPHSQQSLLTPNAYNTSQRIAKALSGIGCA